MDEGQPSIKPEPNMKTGEANKNKNIILHHK